MPFALGPKATAAGYRLAAYESIGSTSTEALERARQGETGPLWIVAGAQTAGHGRRGRPWATPPGNLAASLLLTPRSYDGQVATLGFVAGIALRDAIGSVAPDLDGARLRLKWPNDVLLDGAKVAGILLQATSSPGDTGGLVVGIGVNIASAPQGLPYPATSLAAAGTDVTRETLFEALAESWVGQMAAWDNGSGFAFLRLRWLENAAGLGLPIGVTTGAAALEGIFETIDTEGRLVLRTHDGRRHMIAAGDVHFGAAATAAVA